MGVDRQGKDSGETAPNKSTQRGNENKPSPVDHQVNKTKDQVDQVLKK